ncbi:MAG: acyl-CoA thioesterase [Candidatus Odyssella sp.]|nr:acyl-CoA thioesterase [Candidatus Odyssella sp.]
MSAGVVEANRFGAAEEPMQYVRSYRPFVLRQTVKWSDCDPAGVVYTGRFVEYVTTAFRAFLAQILDGNIEAYVARFGVDFPAKAISFVFESSLRPDDRFDVEVRVAGIRNTTFECEFVGTQDGKPCFTARMTTICVVPVARQAMRVPDGLRARLEPHLVKAAG